MEATIQQLIANNKRPILFEQVPSYPFLPSNCLVKKATYSWMKEENCNIEQGNVMKRQAYSNIVIAEMEDKYPQLMVIRVNELICRGGQCLSELDAIPIYRDNDHLNIEGSRKLFELYRQTHAYQKLQYILQ